MLTIHNLGRIVRYEINTFRVKSMIGGYTNYHISLTDGKGQLRDLKLSRVKNKHGLYTISHGTYFIYLKLSEIENIDTFCSNIKRLV